MGNEGIGRFVEGRCVTRLVSFLVIEGAGVGNPVGGVDGRVVAGVIGSVVGAVVNSVVG